MAVEELQTKDVSEIAKDAVLDIDPKIAEELRNIQAELLNYSTKLVFEVATCECEHKEHCGVFNMAREVAKVMKELQDKAMITIRSGDRTKGRKR